MRNEMGRAARIRAAPVRKRSRRLPVAVLGVDVAEVTKVVLFSGTHLRFVHGVGDVVVAAEMEDAVGEQVGDLGIERVAGGFRLALGRGQSNGDVPEQDLFGHPLHEIIRFVGKRKDIGGFVDAEELEVHLAHFFVVRDEDCKRGAIFHILARHYAHGEGPHRLDVNGWRLDGDLDGDFV